MDFVNTYEKDGIVTVSLNRGKVNPLNGDVVEEILSSLKAIEGDSAVNAVILTGQGKFFSFGFDVPELLTYSREAFSDFLAKFTNLGHKPYPAFAGLKSLLRKPIIDDIAQREKASITKFVDIWHSDSTRNILEKVKIY